MRQQYLKAHREKVHRTRISEIDEIGLFWTTLRNLYAEEHKIPTIGEMLGQTEQCRCEECGCLKEEYKHMCKHIYRAHGKGKQDLIEMARITYVNHEEQVEEHTREEEDEIYEIPEIQATRIDVEEEWYDNLANLGITKERVRNILQDKKASEANVTSVIEHLRMKKT